MRNAAYVECLYAAVASLGVEVVEGRWRGLWPLGQVRRNDLVHLHWPSFYYYIAGSRLHTWWALLVFFARLSLVRLLGARIAWTAHNLFPHEGGRDRRVHRLARKFLTGIANAVFVHGPTPARIVEQELHVAREKLVEIRHGHWIDYYPTTATRETARAELGLPQDAYVFGFIGMCRPYKNLEQLIDAFAKIPSGAILLIAGQFQSQDYLATIRTHLSGLPELARRFFPRFLTNEELPAFVLACDAIVAPYREILTSGSALLALSFGLPIVAPCLGGLRDLIDERFGVLYDPAVRGAFAHALTTVRERRYDRDAILAHARAQSWVETAQALIRVLRREKSTTSAPGS
jgi:beta-1,4-mannosyltransferase